MMEKSVLGGNIKTYASKKGRTSNYRLSCIDFKQESVFDKLLEDEVNKKPVSNKKSYVEKSVVNQTKSYNYSALKVLKNIGNQAHSTRKPSLLPRAKKNGRKVRTKNLQRNKENSKYCSLLYKSNSDSDIEPSGLSVYDIGPKLDPLADYKKRQALRSTQSKQRSRLPSIIKNINTNSRISENKFLPSIAPPTSINYSTSSADKLDPTPAKPDEKVFKKPIAFVEHSSDLFYKNSINKNRGQTKTRKKLSFVNTTLDSKCDANNSFENATGLCRAVQSNVDELFNSDNETRNETRCSVVFNPGTASTPNFDRKITNFGNCGMNKIENEDSLKQLEDTFSFFHLFDDCEQNVIIHCQFSAHSPVIKNEDIFEDDAPDVSNKSLKISYHEATNRSIQLTPKEVLDYYKNESCDSNIHTTTEEQLHTSKKDEFQKTAEHLNYSSSSSDSSSSSSSNNSSSSSSTSSSSDTDGEQPKSVYDSRSGSSTSCNSSSLTSNNDTSDEQSAAEITPEKTCLVKLCHDDTHSSLFTFPGEPKLLDNLNETFSHSNNDEQMESDESSRDVPEKDSLSSCSEYLPSSDDRISFSSSSISGNDSFSNFDVRENFSRVRTSFSSSPISINKIFEENYGTDDLDQRNNLKTELLHVTKAEPDLRFNSPLGEKTTCSTEDVTDDLFLMSIAAEPEVKESSLIEHSSLIQAPIESEIEKSSLIETTEHSSLIQTPVEPEVEKSSLIETIEFLSPIRASIEPKVEESSTNETSECLSLIHSFIKNTSEEDEFVGFSNDVYYQVLKLKEAYESICKELEPKYEQSEDEILPHLKFVTRRRKKTFIMPTLNEENSNLEEEDEVDLCNKARNSPVHSQDVQLGIHNQTSMCASRFLERSSMLCHSIVLATGKKWRRSFITLKNIRDYGFQSQTEHEDLRGRCWRKNVEQLISIQLDENPDLKEIAEISTRGFSNETFANQNCTYLEKCKGPSKARFSLCVNHKSPLQHQTSESSGLISSSDSSKLLGDKSYFSFLGSEQDSRIENHCDLEAGDYLRSHKLSLDCHDIRDHLSARETVLRYCKQTEPLPFEECFNDRLLKNCKKIGEGVYGEVFMLKRNQAHCSVLKIIPIEGDLLINGEKQKKYEEIVSELVISKELSDLRKRRDYFTDNFAELQRCWCVYGKYPNRLIDLWDVYNDKKGSDNDSPKVFDENQLYIILELSHGGEDIESFVFNNAQQALSVFTQVSCALAVAEQAFNFEHRDLHWGNILVSKSKTVRTKYTIGDFEVTVRLRGVKVTIIDYTLSRITVNNCIVFNDIGQDPELFTAQGDFQFEVYRLMRTEVRDIWNKFEPKTNVYWLCYLLDKMIKEVRYRRVSTQIHQNNLDRLNEFFELILGFASCHELVCHPYFKRTISATK